MTVIVHFTDGTRETFFDIRTSESSDNTICMTKKSGGDIIISLYHMKFLEEKGDKE